MDKVSNYKMKHVKNFIISCQIVNNALIINNIFYAMRLMKIITQVMALHLVNGKCVIPSINIALSYLI